MRPDLQSVISEAGMTKFDCLTFHPTIIVHPFRYLFYLYSYFIRLRIANFYCQVFVEFRTLNPFFFCFLVSLNLVGTTLSSSRLRSRACGRRDWASIPDDLHGAVGWVAGLA